MTIVLVGMHGAGKTTLGRALAATLGVPFHEEIGRRLAEDPRMRPAGRTAEDPQGAFDEAVFREELARDAAWEPGAPRVVETWHPGNLAYAVRRSPDVACRLLARFGPAPGVRVLPVRVPVEIAHSRRSEPGDLDFFARVGREAEGWARRLGLVVLEPVWNTGSVEHGVRACLDRLHPLETR